MGGCSGLLILLVTGRHGVGLTHDSTVYLATADNIGHGGRLGYWLEPRLTTWPAGYPLLLAAITKLTQSSVLTAARLICVANAALMPVAVWWFARRVISRASIRMLACAAVTFGSSVIAIEAKALSDALFTTNAVLLFALLLDQPLSKKRALAAGTLAAALFTIRYVGALTVPIGLAGIWATDSSWRTRLNRGVAFGAPSAVLVPAYLAYNKWASGYWLGLPRLDQHTSLRAEIDGFLAAFGSWALGRNGHSASYTAVGALVVGALLAIGVVTLARPAVGAATRGVAAMTIAAIVGLIGLRQAVYFDLDVRTGGFVLPLGVVLCLAAVERSLARGRDRRNGFALVLVGGWVVAIGGLGVRDAAHLRERGSGYAQPEWQEAFAKLRGDLSSVRCTKVASNHPEPLYLAGLQAARLPVDAASALGEGDCVVWVEGDVQSSEFSFEVLLEQKSLEIVGRTETITLARVN